MGRKRPRKAQCACGGLRLEMIGEPLSVYLCHCDACKRITGSAFAYRARYGASAIAGLSGEPRSWRRSGDSGHWVEHVFCGTCGTTMFLRGERLGGDIVVSGGIFADPEFPAPGAAYYRDRELLWMHSVTSGHGGLK